VGLLVFTYVPILASLGLSFSYWNLLGTPTWVGLENYETVLKDPLFWKTFQNTWLFVGVSAVLEVGFGLWLAVLLNQIVRGQSLFRTAYFLPFITPMVSITLVWGWIYDPQYGALNTLLSGLADGIAQWSGGALNREPIAWLYDPRTAMGAVIALRVWKNVGYNLVIFLAGLQNISPDLYESAALDGATPVQTFWKITLPMVSPTLFFVLIVTLINAFQVFDTIYLLTQGGPEHSTEVMVYWMFKNAFEFYKVGPASAIAYLLFIIILVLTVIQWQLRKRWVLHED
jgi:multiple sugar transport system permease protein